MAPMTRIRKVPPRLDDEPVLGIVDPEPLQPFMTHIIKRWREHKNYMKTKERRQFPEALACFHLRVAQILSKRGFASFTLLSSVIVTRSTKFDGSIVTPK